MEPYWIPLTCTGKPGSAYYRNIIFHLHMRLFCQPLACAMMPLYLCFLGKQVSSAEIERIGDDKERIFRELLHLSPLELMPGVMQLLDIFQHQGWQQAIATMTPYENLAAILEKLPIHSYFDVLVTGEQVQKGKPAPDIFLLAAEQLGVEAQQCMVIEDTPMGIEAAQAVGMLAVGIGAAFAAGCGDLFMPNLEAVAEVFQGLLN